MLTTITNNRNHVQQKGFTLVEVMVSLFISLFLLAVIVQSYLSHKVTYRNTTQVSELQDNVRFSAYFLNQGIAEAGNIGCFQQIVSFLEDSPNNQGLYNFSTPVNIWSFQGTELNSSYTIPSISPAAGTSNNQWRDPNDNPLPDVLSDLVIPGTDVIVTSSFSENLPIFLDDTYRAGDNIYNLRTNHNLSQGQIVLVGNCQRADIFQHATANNAALEMQGTILPGNADFSFYRGQPNWSSADEVRRVNHTAYYVGVGANGSPALFRMILDQGIAAAENQIQELVPNVFNTQIIAGENRTNINDTDRAPDIVVAPRAIENLNNVVNLKIGALLSADPTSDLNYIDNIPLRNYTLADTVDITPAESQLNYMVLNRTYKLENSGLLEDGAYLEARNEVTR